MADNSRMSLTINLKWVVLLLLVLIVGMLAAWKPWVAKASDRTIEVTGQAKIKAEPDEFVFSPAYDFKGSDKAIALKELTAKSNDIVAGLKALGLNDDQIKTDSTGYDFPYYLSEKDTNLTYSLRLTVTVDDKDVAQKVQDYLLTTGPTGSVSPQANFSDQKRKELENQARDEATSSSQTRRISRRHWQALNGGRISIRK